MGALREQKRYFGQLRKLLTSPIQKKSPEPVTRQVTRPFLQETFQEGGTHAWIDLPFEKAEKGGEVRVVVVSAAAVPTLVSGKRSPAVGNFQRFTHVTTFRLRVVGRLRNFVHTYIAGTKRCGPVEQARLTNERADEKVRINVRVYVGT